ncbi:hypothetical protein [Vibrio parahaemolyticus]|uniref:hypothetical protein n=1 Tax=Vibrio parahaemolyticus TaxID=670 RepID=UPI00069EA084|nr:hypothetical protein [Vibrio parahaemolyticus]AKU54719.1 hypothetical protein FORC8_1159 [Vibrio parahaemolyticus]APE83775.1 hypothetical protein FORC18_1162 [Vibrio parahaemolyticus]EJI1394788.1 hypothetical protein [Vibrio parahaemolyticus]MCR9859559.1 hypothetical protein [Vibrio parahaemolyticus]TOM93849.1 hypothetical protein CGH66_23980 [Vibrio parahaemolyticus]
MTKIRFYRVQAKDGNGSWTEIVPAHSAGNAEAYNTNPHISVQAEFLGFYEVDIYHNGSGICFEGCGQNFEEGSLGYNYLYSHLRVSVNKFLNDIDY